MSSFSKNNFNFPLHHCCQYFHHCPFCCCIHLCCSCYVCCCSSNLNYEENSKLPELKIERLNDIDILAKTKEILNIFQPSRTSKSPVIKKKLEIKKDDNMLSEIALTKCISNEKKKTEPLKLKKK